MSISKYLTTSPFNEIIKYADSAHFAKDNVSYTGAPRKHPYDSKKVILISDPFSTNTIFYEFKISDIAHVEELSRIATENGENLQMLKIWIKKGSLALRYEPFIVQETINYFKEQESSL